MKTARTIYTTGSQQKKDGETIARQIVVEDWLARPSENDEKNGPREIPAYSRFTVTLIYKSSKQGKKFVFANIPEFDVIGNLQSRIPVIHQLLLERELNGSPVDAADDGQPYTATFNFGTIKGKRVPDVLGSDPVKNLPNLLSQREYLMRYVDRFPANRAMIDEINRAEKEIKSGTYKAKASSAPSEWKAYVKEHKPLASKVDKEGRVLTYGIRILCNPAMDMPWAVSIYNGYCPMTNVNGKDVPEESKMANKEEISFRMSDEEFMQMYGAIRIATETFETCVKRNRIADADKLEASVRASFSK